MTATASELVCAAVLFDLDGVLVSSGTTVERSWRRWARRRGLDPAQVLALCHGRRSKETIAQAAPHLDAHAEAIRLEAEQAADSAEIAACRGAADLLASLPASRWAVVTSGSAALAVSRLRAAGLPEPTVLLAADDVRHGKPEPDGYLAAAARLDVPPGECVVVEDAHPGVLAGRAAGMPVIGVAGPLLGAAEDVNLTVAALTELRAVTGPDHVRLCVRPEGDPDAAR